MNAPVLRVILRKEYFLPPCKKGNFYPHTEWGNFYSRTKWGSFYPRTKCLGVVFTPVKWGKFHFFPRWVIFTPIPNGDNFGGNTNDGIKFFKSNVNFA